MLKTKIISAIALAAFAGATMAQSAAPAALPSTISFDGFCDIFTNISDTGLGTYSAIWDEAGPCGVGSTVSAGGTKANKMIGGKLLTSGAAFTTDSFAAYGFSWGFAINMNKTFSIIDAAGTVVIQGTWSDVSAAPNRGTRALSSVLSR